MPVEIKELVIRAVVSPPDQPARNRRNTPEEGKEAIIEACVRQVLRILRKSKER
jgi:hypothetical protein